MAPDLLKHLPLNTQKELLFTLNASCTTGWCPQAWRTATIVPFLKKEKDPQAVSSYRPIALTSTVGKLLERFIVNRLSWWLEAKSLLRDAVPSRKGSLKVQYFHRYSSCSTSTIFSGISANPPWLVLTLMISL